MSGEPRISIRHFSGPTYQPPETRMHIGIRLMLLMSSCQLSVPNKAVLNRRYSAEQVVSHSGLRTLFLLRLSNGLGHN
jgi:hypothetical protein